MLGHDAARKCLNRYKDGLISVITYIEVLVGANSEIEKDSLRSYLKTSFEIVPLDIEISEIATKLKKDKKIKIPDSIIWATAKYLSCPLLTRNTRDFSKNEHDIIVPYSL